MKCTECGQQFDIADNLAAGSTDGDCAEVKTNCTGCGAAYYTFTGPSWVSEAQSNALIKSERERES